MTPDERIDQLLSQQITGSQEFTHSTLQRIKANHPGDLESLDEQIDAFLAKKNAPIDPAFTPKTIARIKNTEKIIQFPFALFTKIALATAACLTFGLFWSQSYSPHNETQITSTQPFSTPAQNPAYQNERLIALAESLGSDASWLLNEDAPTTLVVALAN